MKKITKSEAFELLNNTKIFVGNPTMSKRVQNQLFKIGFVWDEDKNKPDYLEDQFIFCDDGELTYEPIDVDFFIKHENKEISAMEILDWKIVDDKKDKPTFKPFDKVLVRDCFAPGTWVCGIYSHYNEKICKHITSGGITWNFCIPFEGNEDLLGTMNNPKNVEKMEKK